MALRRLAALVVLLAASTACYHQVVQTGRTAGATVIDKPFVNGFLWGLVAAQDIDVTRECPAGVATVETEQSFANGLVAALTLGIYTPQHVRVTCAATRTSRAPAPEVRIPADADAAERVALSARAIALSVESDAPVVVRY
ncbi:MAG TPA: hypothetical protein VEA99_13480 [Gemmatimonadaceae bacterium]|nr:hypothetical protein [Gemmatimonadaceae bacterium]